MVPWIQIEDGTDAAKWSSRSIWPSLLAATLAMREVSNDGV